LLESRRGRVLRARGAGGCRRRQRQLHDRVRGCGARFAWRWGQAADALAVAGGGGSID
jgi:hypothetical protein